MTRDEMIKLLRAHLSDEQAIGWPTDFELLAYLDSASGALSDQLITNRDPVMMREMTAGLTEEDLPEDFVSLAGNVPLDIVGRKVRAGAGVEMTVRYWAKMPLPSSFKEKDKLPYVREHELLIVDIASMMALNRNEYDVSQDMAVLGQVSKGMSAARGR
jgi:hypothetical protein